MTEENAKMILSEKTKQWIRDLRVINEKYDICLIEKACCFAEMYDDQKSVLYSTSTLQFGLSMAEILVSLNCDSYVITAAIVYPTLFLNPALTEIGERTFDHAIMKLILGALHMEAIHQWRGQKNRVTAQQNQIDNLRKMLLAMVDDIRVILIKLAERLTLCNSLKKCPLDIQHPVAEETMDYYAPLANRLGIGHLKWQLEDESFRYINPTEYQAISKALNMRRTDRERVIHDMISELKTLFKKNGMESVAVTGRAKHIYSIYRKIQKKRVGFQDIYDTSALRILVPTIHDCYSALSLVHAAWPHVSQEFDDYIAKPKSNGYQSIHTVVTRPDHATIEIQIRTFQMHENAELGVAAHWKYKENQTAQSKYETKIAWLREVMDWQKELSQTESNAKWYQEAFKDRVYVFSREGDVFDLAAGATPLDFAYLLHTDIGHRCRGAKVNNLLVPLAYVLHTGDRIEILTSKVAQPSRDWIRADLGYLKTVTAVRKVKHWFRKQAAEKSIAEGLAIWEKAYHQHGLQKTDLQKVISDFNFKTADTLLAALGAGEIPLSTVLHKLMPVPEKKRGDELSSIKITHTKLPIVHFSKQGSAHLLTQIAKCCNPIPGDEVVGYITQGRGISVHQKNCRNIKRALKNNTERLIQMTWEGDNQKHYRVDLSMVGADRTALLRDISSLLSQLNLPILSLNCSVNKNSQTAFITLSLEVNDQNTLTHVLKKLKQIQGVSQVVRK